MKINLIVYFFSNFYMLVFGLIFILPLFYSSKEEYDKVKKIIFGNKLHTYIGFFGIVLTTLEITFPMPALLKTDSVIIFGDFIPSVIILIISITLIFGFIRNSKILSPQLIKKGDDILTSFQIPIGIISVLVCAIHIVAPEAILI